MNQGKTMTLQDAIARMDESVRHYTGVGLPCTAEDAEEAAEKTDWETDEAWQICRVYLTFERPNLQDQLNAWATRHGERIEAVREIIDSRGLTKEEKALLKALGIPYQYDRRGPR